ncbi:DEAD/DEAH box helicase family protein [Shewanella sp. SG44-6]|uniref:DEAD/DEAH box helicase family protein n=1 Tax=Shewanella sp. SG44-6 TaxID=2760959 RepID=UPI0015FFCD9B|nr:DEAD/DEAH box helicase family protein [Shewanella sp. SG44-6]MBB1388331.1 DEAD/DEAH box helicase family protein [Shewanella sp. SG44-6]
MDTVSNIEYVGGQMGFFFGSEDELSTYISHTQGSKKLKCRVQVKANDFLYDFPLSKLGMVTRYNVNVAAIKTLSALNAAQAEATLAEQKTLAKYVGWGGCANVFNPNDAKWSKRHNTLKSLLTCDQWNSAKLSTLSAFYTPDFLSKTIYNELVKAGVCSGTFLDTSAGVGGLVRTMPESLYNAMDINLVEQDAISAQILEKLYPSANIQNMGFENAKFKNPISVVFHNPPFGQAPIFDSANKTLSGLSLHNYFLAKSATLLAKNGWMIAIVSRSFMDSANSKSRALVGQFASLKAAVRLPKQVFEVSTGANATVDVLLFQEGAETNTAWFNAESVKDASNKDYFLNQYFITHPEMIHGEMLVGEVFQGNSVHCEGNNDFENVAIKAINMMFAGQTFNGETSFNQAQHNVAHVERQIIETAGTREGSYAVGTDDEIYQLINESWQATDFNGITKARLQALCAVRHSLMTLLSAEQDDEADATLDELRLTLNQRYDAFVKKFGYVHDASNQRVAKLDPTNYNLLSLEVNYTAGLTKTAAKKLGIKAVSPSAKKAEIFNKRILSPWVIPTHADSIEDALIASVNVHGGVDIAYCASLMDTTEAEFINRTNGHLIFDESGKWVTRNVFLSGDVKTKINTVHQLAYDDDTKQHYIDALNAVLPLDIPFENIKVNLGASWVPANIYQEFVTLLCDGRENSYTKIDFLYAANQWQINLLNLPYQLETRLGSNSAYRFSKLLDFLMNGRPTTVTYKDENGHRIINKQATLENEINAEQIIGEWDTFLLERTDVQDKLTTIFNEQFNRFVKLNADGHTISLPHSNQSIKLRKHQVNAVYRAVTEGRLLLAHEVGAGKTYTLSGIMNTLIRLGLKKRILCVVPNHLTTQFAAGYLELFPQDQITVLNPDDLSPASRQATLLRLKTGSSIVICPESSFVAISPDEDIEQSVIENELAKLDFALCTMDKNNGARFSVKNIENKKAKLKNRLQELAQDDRKKGFTITELGIDCLVLDEAHFIKNLSYESTRLNNVRGCGNPIGSKRAFDWFLKIQCLKRNNLEQGNGLGVYFSTGTPISNTLLEAYTFLRYLDEDMLMAQGIGSIDDFVSSFATVSSDFEVSAAGSGSFKTVTRLRAFRNMTVLQSLWSSIADSVNEQELAKFLPEIQGIDGKNYPAIPPIKGGKARQIIVDATPTQIAFSKYLVSRAKNFKASPVENDNMLLVMSQAKKASIDMRLLNPSIERDEAGFKVPTCVKLTADKYHATSEDRGTQIIFLDLGVPNSDGRHSVYSDIKQGLIDQGVNSEHIVFAQSFKTPKARAEMYSKLNAGEYRVCIASTNTLGCGANVNERLVGITVLDAPYRPADLTQRLGRGIRQGNLLYQQAPHSFTLDITYIATKNSLDSFLFQVLENKQKFISDFNSANDISHSSTDLSTAELTFAELKAETSGSPLVLEMVTLTKSIQRLEAQRHAFIRNQREAKFDIERLNSTLANNQRYLAAINTDKASGLHIPQTGDAFSYINAHGTTFNTVKEASHDIDNIFNPMASSIALGFYQDTKALLGDFAGYALSIKTMGTKINLLVKGSTTYTFRLDLTKQSGFGWQVLNTINNFIRNYDKHITRYNHKINHEQALIEVAETAINASFTELDQLIACKQRMIELKTQISEFENESDTETANQTDDIINNIAA